MKQLIPVIDKRTTVVCLMAAGQTELVEDPFDTIAGDFMAPPFHIHCRSIIAPYLPGMVQDLRKLANKELQTRPKAERRRGPNGELGARIPPPDSGNLPTGYSRPGSAEAAWIPKKSTPPKIPTDPVKGERAAKVAKDSSAKLTAADRAAVSQYRGVVATEISRHLRNQEPMPSRLQAIFDGIMAAFERVRELKQAITAYRGISTAALPTNLVGMTIKDQGITTTALQVGVVMALLDDPAGKAIVEVVAGPSTKALILQPGTAASAMLLPPGTVLRFVSDEWVTFEGRRVRYLRAVIVDG